MTTQRSSAWAVALATALALTLAPAASGQDFEEAEPQLVIPAGIDIFTTPDDGQTYVEDLHIPAGYFCKASPAMDGVAIPLKGTPIATNPADVLGTTDTVVHRTEDAAFSGGVATVSIEVVGLSLVGAAPFEVDECGQSYTVRVVPDSPQPTGSWMEISLNQAGNGGTFDSALEVAGQVIFEGDSGPVGEPLLDTVFLTTEDGAWADEVGGNGVDHPDPVQIDRDGSGSPNGPELPGTSGFHAGWSPEPQPGCSNPPCHVVIDEQARWARHFTAVPRPKSTSGCPSESDLDVVLQTELDSTQSLEFEVAEPCQVEVTDAQVTEVSGSNCTTDDLSVLEGGSERDFSVVSRDPCVLDL